jgi:hypothetical protein
VTTNQILGGAAIGAVANALKSEDEQSIRNVYLVTSDIQYSGINLTVIAEEARELVNKIRKNIITQDDFTHWSLQVGDGDEACFFEIMSFNVTKRQELKVKKWSASEKQKIMDSIRIGQTSLPNEMIGQICKHGLLIWKMQN